MLTDRVEIDSAGEVSDQCITRRTAPDGDRRVRDAVDAGEDGLDLPELDALSAQLHLEVCPAEVFERTGGVPAHQVTGPVEAASVRAGGVGHEPFGGEVGPGGIAARQLIAADVQLADHPDRRRAQPVVQHPRGGVRVRAPDRHDHVAGGEAVRRHLDGRLRRPVEIVEVRLRHERRHGLGGGGRQCLARRVDTPQRRQCRAPPRVVADVLDERRHHRRHEVYRGDPMPLDLGEDMGRVDVAAVLDDDEAGPGHQRFEQLGDGHVEGDRRLEQNGIVGTQRGTHRHPCESVEYGTVTDRDSLRRSGRAGREQRVEGVARTRATEFRPGTRAVLRRGVSVDDEGRYRQTGQRGRGHLSGQDDRDRRGVDHRGHSFGRSRRVDADIAAAGHHHRVDREHQLHRPRDTHAHGHFRTHAVCGHRLGQLGDPVHELAVGHGSRTGHQGRRLR